MLQRQVLPDPGPRFGPGEPARDPLMHPVQLRRSDVRHHAGHHAFMITQLPLQRQVLLALTAPPPAASGRRGSFRAGGWIIRSSAGAACP